jgi:hypothetical protein
MQNVDVNYLAVLASGIIAMVIGFLWYSPALFGNAWMKLNGFTKEKMDKAMKEGMAKTYGIMFVSALVMSYVLAHVIAFAGGETVMDGLQGGIWVWLGFVATTMLNGVLFGSKPLKLYLIDVGYYLVLLMVIGAVLAVWR